MDELLHHCIRELAFEGDLGCHVNRLQDFIAEFYAHSGSQQNVDAAYCAFIWSVIVGQPGVRVGIAPKGTPEVFIAPQPSKGTSATKGKKKRPEDDDNAAGVGELEIVQDAVERSLDDLKAEYGDNLRIAVDPQRSFVAITGSHIRPSKLTPMVYSALQLVSRGRENGISVVDLSKKTGYDPKTCHYLVEKLVELNLIEKRKKSGIGANFCIHKYFFERSEVWQDVLAKEGKATQSALLKKEDPDVDMDDEEPTPNLSLGHIQFEPIETRHLSSLAIVQNRLETLLNNSPNKTHRAQNLLVTIGFPNPAKSDRRFFQTRLRELIAQGVVEKVQVREKNGKDKFIPCIRLINADGQERPDALTIDEVEDDELPTLKSNIPFHRQMIDLIDQSGKQGITLNELSQALCTFDKRTVDHQLNRLKDASVPPHLRDLGIAQVGESHGRERRYKYFTARNYQEMAEREKLSPPFENDYFAQARGFMPIDVDQFYTDKRQLNKYVDDYQAGDQERKSKSKGRGKQKDKAAGNPRASQKRKREEMERGSENEEDEEAASPAAPSAKKRRGRPPKVSPPETPVVTLVREGAFPALAVAGPSKTSEPASAPKKRGRPPKKKPDATPTAPKKRGRPPKSSTQEVVQGSSVVPTPDEPAVVGQDAYHLNTVPLHDIDATYSFLSQNAPDHHPIEDAFVLGSPIRRSANSIEPSFETDSGQAAFASGGPIMVDTQASGLATVGMLSESGPATEPTVVPDLLRPIPDEPSIPQQSASEARTAGGAAEFVSEGVFRNQPEPTSSSATTSAEAVAADVPSGAVTQNKRSAFGTPPPQPALKRLKTGTPQTGYRTKPNISQSRREKEILRVIAEKGGIVNVSSKEFYDAHAEVIEALVKAGEAVSTRPGSRIDKRTVDSTLRDLEDHGKAKMITTILGANRTVKIAYLTDTSQEAINLFLSELGRAQTVTPAQPSIKTVEQPISYGGARSTRVARSQVSLVILNDTTHGDRDKAKATELLKADDETIKESLLTEPNTVAQLYGFIVSKLARARELHLHIIEVFEQNTESCIVSGDQRVLHLSYFFDDLPISVYCAIISCRFPNGELEELLSTSEGRATPVNRVSSGIVDTFEMNKARSRTRMLDMLVVLQHLQVVTPLLPSNSDRPWLRCAPNNDHPTAFDTTTYDGTAPLQAPQYWRFNTIVPIHLWALDETSPPFWMNATIQSSNDAVEFWHNLQRASIDQTFAEKIVSDRESGELIAASAPAHVPGAITKSLRRSPQWKKSYTFSFFQKQFLKQHTDFRNATTPLQDADRGETRLLNIAYVVSAPLEDITQFYEHERTRMLHDIDKARKKTENMGEQSKRHADERNSLAQKAAQARAQKERNWEEMVLRVHPEPLEGPAASRVKHLRTKFLQGTGIDLYKWEAEIASAIEGARIPTQRATTSRITLVPTVPSQPVPAPSTVQSQEKSVEDLIAHQGPIIAKKESTEKKKGKGKGKGKEKDTEDATEKTVRRRHRFQWTKDYEDLARDASAVIKARCRDGARLDWAALEQVFPAVPRNSVRQRIAFLRGQGGAEAYLKRLEDRWYDLWVKYRGTPELPDDDPSSLSNFDIVAHINFLRRHVDKTALRVGFLETEEPTLVSLPTTVDALLEGWQVVEKFNSDMTWDFMWQFASEEGREKQLIQQSFVLAGPGVPTLRSHSSETVSVGEAALKMMLGTHNDAYDADHASRVLASVGESEIKKAMQELVDQGVASKVVRDPKKTRPGRLLKVSEANQNAMGGPVAAELFQDSSALEEALTHQEDSLAWKDWPLLASDGDTAALIELVSENKVTFKVDTSGPQAALAKVDWNSKKAADDDFETAIQVRITTATDRIPHATHLPPDAAMIIERGAEALNGEQPQINENWAEGNLGDDAVELHLAVADHPARTFNDEQACCSQALANAGAHSGLDIVDCKGCVDLKVADLSDAESDDGLPKRMHDALVASGSSGMSKIQLLACVEPFDRSSFSRALVHLVSAKLVFWAGHREIVLVSALFLRHWTVIISPGPQPPPVTPIDQAEALHESEASEPGQNSSTLVRIFPRRWLDIYGHKMADIWNAACRAVIGTIVFRPGLSQAELRWRLRTVYDREEVHDVLLYLVDNGYIGRKPSSEVEDVFPADSPADNMEERSTFWFIGEKHWFAV